MSNWYNFTLTLGVDYVFSRSAINLLKPTGYVMHQQV